MDLDTKPREWLPFETKVEVDGEYVLSLFTRKRMLNVSVNKKIHSLIYHRYCEGQLLIDARAILRGDDIVAELATNKPGVAPLLHWSTRRSVANAIVDSIKARGLPLGGRLRVEYRKNRETPGILSYSYKGQDCEKPADPPSPKRLLQVEDLNPAVPKKAAISASPQLALASEPMSIVPDSIPLQPEPIATEPMSIAPDPSCLQSMSKTPDPICLQPISTSSDFSCLQPMSKAPDPSCLQPMTIASEPDTQLRANTRPELICYMDLLSDELLRHVLAPLFLRVVTRRQQKQYDIEYDERAELFLSFRQLATICRRWRSVFMDMPHYRCLYGIINGPISGWTDKDDCGSCNRIHFREEMSHNRYFAVRFGAGAFETPPIQDATIRPLDRACVMWQESQIYRVKKMRPDPGRPDTLCISYCGYLLVFQRLIHQWHKRPKCPQKPYLTAQTVTSSTRVSMEVLRDIMAGDLQSRAIMEMWWRANPPA